MPYSDKNNPKRKLYLQEYKRQWHQKRRCDFFADKYCVICGSKDNLELDHIDPATKTSHRIWSWSEERRTEELAKCQVLCRLHHKEKTTNERRVNEHGATGYTSYKCRCDICKAAHAQQARIIRANRK